MADDPGDGPRRGAPPRRRRSRGRRYPAHRLTCSCATWSTDAARALLASGIERGDRVAVWAPNSLEWIVAALGVTTAGGVLVPVNTRFRGAEAAYVLARSGARVLFTVRGFLDTDYPALLAERRRRAARARAHGPARRRRRRPRATSTLGRRSSRRGRARRRGRRSTRASRRVDRHRRPERRRVHVGHHRQPQGRGHDPRPDAARPTSTGATGRTCAPGDRYLIANPFFHIFGYKAGCLASLMRGATIFPVAVFDAGVGARARRARADLGAPGAADDLPVAARPSRPRPPRHLDACASR